MSCYIVSPHHINAIVTAFLELRGNGASLHVDDVTRIECQRYADMLAQANHGSVSHHYTSAEPLDLSIYEFRAIPFHGGPHAVVLARVILACDCYDYQSCESPSWEGSEARAFVADVRKSASSAIARLHASGWGVDESDYFVAA